MKFALVLMLSLTSLAHAQNFSQQTLKKALKVASCEMKIKQNAIVFGKDHSTALSQKMVFSAHDSSSELRRLKKNRILKIHSVTHKNILLDDPAVNSICVLEAEKSRCSRELHKLTISEIEQKAGGNVSINCQLDPVRDI